jgi:hypothetical protein
MAVVLLERNGANRPVVQGRIDMYAQDMVAGAWHLNNQGVGLGPDGRLFDGQHRLRAIVRARTAVELLLVGGLSEQARGTIDQGRARSLGDNLRILYGEVDGHRLSTWLNAIEVMLLGRPKTLSLDMALQRRAHYEPSIRWLCANGPRTRPLYYAALGGALLYAHRVAPELVESVVPRYISGAELPAGSPVLLLRNYMTSRSGDPTRIMALKVLRALLLEQRNERLERLPASEEGLDHFRKLHTALAMPVAA